MSGYDSLATEAGNSEGYGASSPPIIPLFSYGAATKPSIQHLDLQKYADTMLTLQLDCVQGKIFPHPGVKIRSWIIFWQRLDSSHTHRQETNA